MYAVTRSLANASDRPSVASDTMPRHANSSYRLVIVANELLYQPMAVSRRAALRGWAAAGPGPLAGGGIYGYVYERHARGVTRTIVPVVDLPVALNGLRIGLITDLHRSSTVSHEDVAHAVRALMAERPDLVVL